MRRIGICCCAVVLLGCGKTKDESAMDQAAQPATDSAMTAPAAAPAPISLSDLNGKWKMRVSPEGSDSTLLEFTMDAAPEGWTLHFPNRPAVTTKPVAEGDSIVADAGPYESALRKGQKVTTHSVYRLQDGKLVGTTMAHYDTKGADSVKALHTEGTRE